MQPIRLTLALLLFWSVGPAIVAADGEEAEDGDPLGKVLQLMDDLIAKVKQDGVKEEKAYHEYYEWCDDATKNTRYEIETYTTKKGKLESKIDELGADIEATNAKIEELANSITGDEAELKEATVLRNKEEEEFEASQEELVGVIDSISRAVDAIQRNLEKLGGSSLAQVDTSSMRKIVSLLELVADAAAFNAEDRQRLMSMVQEHDQEEDSDLDSVADTGAPDPAAYKAKAGGIVDVLDDLKDKALAQLNDLRTSEVRNKQNFEMLKQGLEEQITADNKGLAEEKAEKGASAETKATAEGELEVSTKALKKAQAELANTQKNCMQVASDHDATVTSREQELVAIGKAKKILEEATGKKQKDGGSSSFLQVATAAKHKSRARVRMRSKMHAKLTAKLATNLGELVGFIKQLAKEHHSRSLVQLSSRIGAILEYGTDVGEDPLKKVKELIASMVAALEKQAGEEAAEKAYCDDELGKTQTKHEELVDGIEKMTAKIDSAAARSSELKDDIKELQAELSVLAKDQADMDKIRMETHADFVDAKKDLETAIAGVRKAVGVLRDYYNNDDDAASALQTDSESQFDAFMQQPSPPKKHTASGGAGSGLIAFLEIVESNFATSLAKEETEEADKQGEYDKMTQENAISKASKEKDAAYKSQESKSLLKLIAQITGDRQNANEELNAVSEYFAKLKERCIAKPEAYAERAKRRQAEIAGLRQALTILDEQAAFAQIHESTSVSRSFRGTPVA